MIFLVLCISFYLHFNIGPKTDGTRDSQDEDGAEEEEEVGRVNDGDDDDLDDEPQTGALTEGMEEQWMVSSHKSIRIINGALNIMGLSLCNIFSSNHILISNDRVMTTRMEKIVWLRQRNEKWRRSPMTQEEKSTILRKQKIIFFHE